VPDLSLPSARSRITLSPPYRPAAPPLRTLSANGPAHCSRALRRYGPLYLHAPSLSPARSAIARPPGSPPAQQPRPSLLIRPRSAHTDPSFPGPAPSLRAL